MFFVEVTTDKTHLKDAVIGELTRITTRGGSRLSNKNENVVTCLTGSDKTTALLHGAAKKVLGSCPIKDEHLYYFARLPRPDKKPYMNLSVSPTHVNCTGNLYMLVPFLTDPDGLNAEPICLDTNYQILIEDDFPATEITDALERLCATWGWTCNKTQG